ncbi:MAG: Asp-tRNA(Asn)/Glu-tRNA(Gln) amidotransferase subunit GatB [bacterium]
MSSETTFRSMVGLEIHVQLKTESKIFCSCPTTYGEAPNTNVCPVCLGYPGTLPVLNHEAVRLAYLVARSLNCTLAERAVFARKNYFYPDLPKNYQISQFDAPIGTNGYIDIEVHKQRRRVRIHEVHLEEDAGKMIHAGDVSLLDFNRTGTPLLEIVTEPDLEIGAEAEVLLLELRRLVRYLGASDGNMEEGSLRCDANVSIAPRGAAPGTKVEIKNMNSSRFVRKALTYEIERQEEVLANGGTIVQETRLWNENRDITEAMRGKETSSDYRYFPEPDLPVFRSTPEFLDSVERGLVERPQDREDRLVAEHGLTATQAHLICEERATADFFEETVSRGAGAAEVAVWIAGDVRKELNRRGVALSESALTPARLAQIIRAAEEHRIPGRIAKRVLAATFEEDQDPDAIIAQRGWALISDRATIAGFVDEVLAANEKAVAQVRSGDSRPFGFLVGQVMKASGGRAEPQAVNELLRSMLSVRVIDLISFGGAISGVRGPDGLVAGGGFLDHPEVRQILGGDAGAAVTTRVRTREVGRFLSEEVGPEDWARLIHHVRSCVEGAGADGAGTGGQAGGTSGIVITHGTDTLAYTASLLYWLFGSSDVPIVLTASASPWEIKTDGAPNTAVEAVRSQRTREVLASEEPASQLRYALTVAQGAVGGVHVAFRGADLSPVNLKFERLGNPEFRTWNADALTGRTPPPADLSELGEEELRRALEAAARQVALVRVYPGMRSDTLIAMMNTGVHYFVLELYDTGTASVRETPYSLRRALEFGRDHGGYFFCTSQQEGIVDFSEYVTGHELWKEGAIPMGAVTSETAYTRLLALALQGLDGADLVERMEESV